jgi:RNA polymerase sigma-70 factor (ECF subfamily)
MHHEWPGHWAVPPTPWPAMQDVRAQRGAGRVLRDALARLPTGQRVVVGLRDVAGFELGEIATIVAQPPERVRDDLHRGRAELRRHLELHVSQPQPA